MNHWKEQVERKKKEGLHGECQRLISAGKRVEAIKLYRAKTGADLRKAMADLELKHL